MNRQSVLDEPIASSVPGRGIDPRRTLAVERVIFPAIPGLLLLVVIACSSALPRAITYLTHSPNCWTIAILALM
jgi:hypothetical protein